MKLAPLKYAKNKSELCRILDVARTTLDAWLQLPDHPLTRDDGRYEIEAWKAFKAGRGIDPVFEESAELKLKKLRNEVAQSEVDLMKSVDEVMPIEFVSRLLAHLVIGVRRVIESADISAEAREFMYSGVEAIDTDKFLAEMFEEAGARRAPGAINEGADEG